MGRSVPEGQGNGDGVWPGSASASRGSPCSQVCTRGSARKRLTLEGSKVRMMQPSPISVRFHERGYIPTAFRHLPSRTLHYPGSASPGRANKGAWVRGSLTAQTPAPRLPGRAPLEAHLQAAAEVSPSPLCASLSPLIRRRGSPWLGSEGPFSFDFPPNRKPGPTRDTAN